MPMIQPNLSDVVSFDPPVGTWPGQIVSIVDKPSSSGNPMLTVEFLMEIEGFKYSITGWYVYTGRSAYGFENLLRATGFGDIADQIKRGEVPQFNTDDLMDQRCQVVVEERVDKRDPTGNTKTKSVKALLPA